MKLIDAFEVLKREGITTHENSIRRWIRKGDLKATLTSRKEGYRIEESDLLAFMETKLSAKRYEEIQKELMVDKEKVEKQISGVRIEFVDKLLEIKLDTEEGIKAANLLQQECITKIRELKGQLNAE